MSRTTQNRRKKLARRRLLLSRSGMDAELSRMLISRQYSDIIDNYFHLLSLFQTPKDGMTKSPTLQDSSHDAIVKDVTPNSRK